MRQLIYGISSFFPDTLNKPQHSQRQNLIKNQKTLLALLQPIAKIGSTILFNNIHNKEQCFPATILLHFFSQPYRNDLKFLAVCWVVVN